MLYRCVYNKDSVQFNKFLFCCFCVLVVNFNTVIIIECCMQYVVYSSFSFFSHTSPTHFNVDFCY